MFLPRRLLDLGPTDQSLPRVVDTTSSSGESTIDRPCKYATLSYCWGPPQDASQQLLLTAESKDTLYEGLSMKHLTPVVRDAVTTCRTLGFRFLWVDALCILQHNIADWEEQSYEMERIFTGSALCICVMTSSSCLKGFLHQRHHIQLALPWISTIDGSPFQETLTLILCSSRRKHLYRDRNEDSLPPLERDLSDSPWNSRGWVFRKSTYLLVML